MSINKQEEKTFQEGEIAGQSSEVRIYTSIHLNYTFRESCKVKGRGQTCLWETSRTWPLEGNEQSAEAGWGPGGGEAPEAPSALCVCMYVSRSVTSDTDRPRTVARQVSLSLGFSMQ